jgi:hypothetical protein
MEEAGAPPAPAVRTVAVSGVIDTVFVNEAGDIVVITEDGSQQTVPRKPARSAGPGGKPETVVVEDSAGNRYRVNPDGTVTNMGTTSATTVAANVNYRVDFRAEELQRYGFDAPSTGPLQRHYRTERIGDTDYPIAWKSVATGSFDQVQAVASVPRPAFAQEIAFASPFGPLAKVPGHAAGQVRVTVQGRSHEAVEEVRAYLSKSDTAGRKTERTVGRLNVIAYDAAFRTLVLVPVGGTALPIDRSALERELNRIYGQAAVQWAVRTEEGFQSTYDTNNNGLDYGSSGLLSNYTAEMRTILKDYTRSRPLAPHTYYLFVVPRANQSEVTGYMPRRRLAGFLFAENITASNAAKIIAHELGHGAFRLKHTFPELPQNGNNLMDYSATGITLHKHQWDDIHHPQTVLGLFEGDEEGAMAVQIAQCLTGAALDFTFYYSAIWISMLFDDSIPENQKPSFTDFSNITGYKDFNWTEASISAGISCGAAILPPILAPETARKMAVGLAALGGAATGFATETARQYELSFDRLKQENLRKNITSDPSLREVVAGIEWSPVIRGAAATGVITGAATWLATSPKFATLQVLIKNRLKITNLLTEKQKLIDFLESRSAAGVAKGGDDLADLVKRFDNLTPNELQSLFSKISKSDIKVSSSKRWGASTANQNFKLEYISERVDVNLEDFIPPYKKGTFADEIVLAEDVFFIRVHNQRNQVGRWMMTVEDFKALSADQAKFKDLFALPSMPSKASLVKVPKGTKIWKGQVDGNPWGNGGGIQVQVDNWGNYRGEAEQWFKEIKDL